MLLVVEAAIIPCARVLSAHGSHGFVLFLHSTFYAQAVRRSVTHFAAPAAHTVTPATSWIDGRYAARAPVDHHADRGGPPGAGARKAGWIRELWQHSGVAKQTYPKV